MLKPYLSNFKLCTNIINFSPINPTRMAINLSRCVGAHHSLPKITPAALTAASQDPKILELKGSRDADFDV